jgi:hypothetical protein
MLQSKEEEVGGSPTSQGRDGISWDQGRGKTTRYGLGYAEGTPLMQGKRPRGDWDTDLWVLAV